MIYLAFLRFSNPLVLLRIFRGVLMIGKYKLKNEKSFRCGVSVFTLSAGSIVEVTQTDKEYLKILIKFSDRETDWYPDTYLWYLERV